MSYIQKKEKLYVLKHIEIYQKSLKSFCQKSPECKPRNLILLVKFYLSTLKKPFIVPFQRYIEHNCSFDSLETVAVQF